MYFRFGSALCLVVAVSMLGIAIEKQNLELRRDLSRQHYRMDVLQNEHARLRLQTQKLAAVQRLFETIGPDEKPGAASARQLPPAPPRPPDGAPGEASPPARRVPLLFWQRTLPDPRLDDTGPD